MCKTVKSEQSGSTAASSAIEKAMTSGNYAAAKQALLNSFNTDFNQVQKALAVIKGAPPKVQAAFKDLLSFVKQLRTAIQSSTSVTSLLAPSRRWPRTRSWRPTARRSPTGTRRSAAEP